MTLKVTLIEEKTEGEWLGEACLTVFDSGCSLIPQLLTDTFKLIGRSDQAFETALEMFCKI